MIPTFHAVIEARFELHGTLKADSREAAVEKLKESGLDEFIEHMSLGDIDVPEVAELRDAGATHAGKPACHALRWCTFRAPNGSFLRRRAQQT